MVTPALSWDIYLALNFLVTGGLLWQPVIAPVFLGFINWQALEYL
jgi:hypothetical protein